MYFSPMLLRPLSRSTIVAGMYLASFPYECDRQLLGALQDRSES